VTACHAAVAMVTSDGTYLAANRKEQQKVGLAQKESFDSLLLNSLFLLLLVVCAYASMAERKPFTLMAKCVSKGNLSSPTRVL